MGVHLTQEIVPAFPKVLRIEPASQCNLACSHCPTGTVTMDRGIMTNNIFERVLEEIEKNRQHIKIIVLYHGGEPLINRFFCDYIQKIKEINQEFYLKTVSNGMALTSRVAEKLLNSGLDAIEFSLDGISAEESEFVRDKSKTAHIVKNVKNFIALKKQSGVSKPGIYISTTQFMQEQDLADEANGPATPAWLLEEFNEDVEYKSGYAVKWPHMGDSGKFDFLTVEGEDADECDHVISTMTVRADGAIVPCCHDLTSKLVMGNILTENLMDIWHNANYARLRDSIRNKDFISICATCATVKPPTYLLPKWRNASLKAELPAA